MHVFKYSLILLFAALLLATSFSAAYSEPITPITTPTPTPTPRPLAPIATLAPLPGGLPELVASEADQELLDLRLTVGRVQSAYRAAHGTFWQAAPTHAKTPAAGRPTAPDPLARVPDVPAAWHDLSIDLPESMPCAVRVDVYEGPHGAGYTLTALVDYGGRIWTRVVNVGPESWREHGWSVPDEN